MTYDFLFEMHFIRLTRVPTIVVRYIPHYNTHRYQYHFTDQKDKVFVDAKNTLHLTSLNTTYKSFSNIVDVFFFLTNFKYNLPKNLKDVFEISRDRKTWLLVKRPLLHDPCIYLQTIQGLSQTAKKKHRFTRRRHIPKNGTQTIHKQTTVRLCERSVSRIFSKKIQDQKNNITYNNYIITPT